MAENGKSGDPRKGILRRRDGVTTLVPQVSQPSQEVPATALPIDERVVDTPSSDPVVPQSAADVVSTFGTEVNPAVVVRRSKPAPTEQSQVVRRRATRDTQSPEIRPERGYPKVSDEIAKARERLLQTQDRESVRELHAHQVVFVEKFDTYFLGITNPDAELRADENGNELERMSRIESAPRTGKTTIAAEIIRRTGLRTVFYVPTDNLLYQTYEEFSELLPDKKIVLYAGKEKGNIGDADIIISTYAVGQFANREGKAGLPEAIKTAPLVFADEGHETMTEDRMKLIRESFDPEAIRVALSGTPDYSEKKKLEQYYPTLIHELRTPEAVALGMLAPFEYFVYEVDIDASNVNIDYSSVGGGEYDAVQLEKVMNQRPVNEFILQLRALEENANTPALITVSSKDQAKEIARMMKEQGITAAVILEDTPNRQEILEAYEAGQIDTLITISVLMRGWDSKRCKLLIDGAPTISPVRAGQKYTRPLTKDGEATARIYTVIPSNLQTLPLLPPDVLIDPDLNLPPGHVMRSRADLEAKQKDGGEEKQSQNQTSQPVLEFSGVRAKPVYELKGYGGLQKVALERNNPKVIREIIVSGAPVRTTGENAQVGAFADMITSYSIFQRTYFQHEKFSGYGRMLLLALDIKTQAGFDEYMAHMFPREVASGMLMRRELSPRDIKYAKIRQELAANEEAAMNASTDEDIEYLRQASESTDPKVVMAALEAIDMLTKDPDEPMEDRLHEYADVIHHLPKLTDYMRTHLSQRQQFVMESLVNNEDSLNDCGVKMGLSRERVRMILREALLRLRDVLESEDRTMNSSGISSKDYTYAAHPELDTFPRNASGIPVRNNRGIDGSTSTRKKLKLNFSINVEPRSTQNRRQNQLYESIMEGIRSAPLSDDVSPHSVLPNYVIAEYTQYLDPEDQMRPPWQIKCAFFDKVLGKGNVFTKALLEQAQKQEEVFDTVAKKIREQFPTRDEFYMAGRHIMSPFKQKEEPYEFALYRKLIDMTGSRYPDSRCVYYADRIYG